MINKIANRANEELKLSLVRGNRSTSKLHSYSRARSIAAFNRHQKNVIRTPSSVSYHQSVVKILRNHPFMVHGAQCNRYIRCALC